MAEKNHTKAFYNTEIPSDWTTPEFGDVFNFLKTFSFSREQLTSEPTNDGIRNIHYGDIHATYENEILDLDIEKTVPYLLDGLIDLKSFDEECFPALKEGDLIIADASEDYEGVCDCVELKNINGAKVVSGLHTFAARTSKEKIALGYRTYALQHELVIRELRRIATGTSVYGVSKTNLSKVKIPLPPLPEQKTIAQLLSTADAAIHITEKLIAQKELRKKWLMQQLLTGKKRLEGFGGEWKFVRFKEIYSQVKQKAGDEKFLVLSVTKDGIVSQAEYFNKEIASEDTSPYLVVRKGDMAMSGLNFWMGSIDVLVEYEIGMVSPAYKVFEIHNPEISATFMKSFVRSEIMLQCLIGSSVVGASIVRRNLDRETLDEWSFRLPLLEEQTAIAHVLQAADKEISLLKAKAVKLREQKKGLMQQLLTGKVRLKINNT